MGIAPRQPRTPPGHPTVRAINKLRHASAVLSELSGRWNAFRAGVQVSFDPTYDAETDTIQYFAHVVPVPPFDDYEAPVRNVVGEARSALDNLVYDLGVLHGANPKQLGKNAFPVIDSGEPAAWAGRGPAKLAGIPPDVASRIRDVQPFMARQFPVAVHPLTLLARLSNDDKHRWGIEIGLVPSVVGTHKLTTMKFELPRDVAKALTDRTMSPDEVDAMLHFDPNPVVEDRPVAALRLPAGVEFSAVTLAPLDLPLSLAVVSLSEEAPQPVFPALSNALRWARETVRYVAGGAESPPAPFGPGVLVDPEASSA